MKPVGWEMRPLGWLLLFVIVAILSYFIVRTFRRVPPPSEPEA
jgi:hypothetical protein